MAMLSKLADLDMFSGFGRSPEKDGSQDGDITVGVPSATELKGAASSSTCLIPAKRIEISTKC